MGTEATGTTKVAKYNADHVHLNARWIAARGFARVVRMASADAARLFPALILAARGLERVEVRASTVQHFSGPGYSEHSLQRKMRNGELPFVGAGRSRRLRRGDTPIKAERGLSALSTTRYDADADARRALAGPTTR